MPNYTILLIDYEPKSIDRVRRPLMGVGYKVEVATDGVSGIEAFHRLKPDLVMIEAMIPKKHGFEVCQEIKKSPQGKRTPVIITTSVYKGRKYRNQAFHLHGCDEYLEKPIDEEQIVTVCRRMVGDNGPIQAASSLPEGFESNSASAESAPPVEFSATSDIGEGQLEFPPVPPAPPGMDDDELEIMARLDSILPGASSSGQRAASPPPPAPMPPAPPPTVSSAEPPARDIYATSFFPSVAATPNQDLALQPIGSIGTSTATEEPPVMRPIEEERKVTPLPSYERESLDQADAFPETGSSESRRSKRRDRRKKGNVSAPAAATPRPVPEIEPEPEPISASVDHGVPAMSEPVPMITSFPQAEPPSETPSFATPDTQTENASRVDPFDSPPEEETGGSRWVSVAAALILLGVAGALIYMYLGN